MAIPVAQNLLSLEGRTEQVIAAGRAVLAAASLLAIWLDASEPSKYASLTYALLAVYVLYSLVIVAIVAASSSQPGRLPIATHVFDLMIFSVFIYLTEGPTSPFFVYFVFSIFCAMLRWQWHGALVTAAIALSAFVGMGIYAEEVLQDPAFELNRFIIRAFYLVVVTALVAYVGVHELHRRKQLTKLAEWSRMPVEEIGTVLLQVLERAANILETPRVLLIWDEEEEPWVNVVMFERGALKWDRKPPGTFDPLVESSLEDRSFLSSDVSRNTATVVERGSTTPNAWYGEALNPELRDLFDIRSALSAPVSGGNLHGRLFFLDKQVTSVDDLQLAEVVAGQAAASIDLHYFMHRLRRVVALDERIRLSRDLHDGVLQSLTAAGLRLQSALQLIKTRPDAVAQELRSVQDIIFDAQLDLRLFVNESRAADQGDSESSLKLTRLLESLQATVEQQWGLRVNLKLDGSQDAISAAIAREIYYIVREALVNAGRHSGGSSATAYISVDGRQASITVSDEGRRAPAGGSPGHAGSLQWIPVSLKNRISTLKGSLDIHSTEAGTRIDIVLPLEQGVT